jgi:IS605 OrfB family transposase
VKQTLPVKLAPSSAQHAALLATMERFNLACDWIAGEAFRDRCANKIELQKTVYYPVREQFGLSAQLTVRAISKTVEAYKRDKDVQPRFRSHGAVPYDERIMSFKGVEAVSLLALDGRQVVPMRFGAYQAARIDRRQGQADLVYRDGVFYLYVTIDTPEPPVEEAADYLGIDLGIVNLATDSDGTVYSGDTVEAKRRIYTHRRRNLQRKGTHAARRKLRRIAGHQARYQADTNHVISKAVVRQAKDTGRGLAVEKLGGIGTRTATVRRPQRARQANWAFFQLRSFLSYKAALAGVAVVAVDPRNTSRECPDCGFVAKANRVSRSSFVCGSCGLAGPSDHLAARVIRARAAVMQPKVPEAGQPVAPGTSSLL